METVEAPHVKLEVEVTAAEVGVRRPACPDGESLFRHADLSQLACIGCAKGCLWSHLSPIATQHVSHQVCFQQSTQGTAVPHVPDWSGQRGDQARLPSSL